MESKLKELTGRFERRFGDRLVSLILYGSAAAGDYQDRFSDLNVLCVLRAITPRELAEAEEIFRWWRAAGNPAPLLLSEDEVLNAADCFPMEFLDIQACRRVLSGRDIIGGVVVDRHFLRARVEFELRSKLIRLRQKAASILSEDDPLRQLLADSLSTFCVLIRHALLLEGTAAGPRKREILDQARRSYALDTGPFDRLLALREGALKPRDVDPVSVLTEYLKQIETVIRAVDRIER